MTERRASYRARRQSYFDACVLLNIITREDKASELEAELLYQLHDAGLLALFEREAKIVPGRNFRFDLACKEYRIAVEVNGGTYSRMGHSTGTGIARDYEKSNLAQMAGWLCLSFDGPMVSDGRALALIRQAVEAARRGEI